MSLPFRSSVKYTAPLLFLLVILVYLSNGRVLGSGDTLPARYLPIGLLRYGTFYLDKFPVLYNQHAVDKYASGEATPYYLTLRNGHYVSTYTPGPALLALPVYALPVFLGMSSTSHWVPRLEKLSATLIVAASVIFLFLALSELVGSKWALLIALAYAFGTSSFSVSSQALWEHGPSQFFLALALYLLVKGRKGSRYIPYAGGALACAVVMRPTDALIALPLGLYVIHKHFGLLRKFLLFAAPPLFLFLLYSYVYLGAVSEFPLAEQGKSWREPLLAGLSGLLVSPGRGLFVYSPIVLLSLAGMVLAWRRKDVFLRYLSVGPILVVLLYSKWFMWWGGYCYGPRLLADLAPILCFLLYPLCESATRLRVSGRRLLLGTFALLLLLSVGMQSIGTYWDSGRWDVLQDVDHHPERLWSWTNAPFVYYGRYPYWDAGQVADWLGVRQEIHSLFQRFSGHFMRPKVGEVHPPGVLISEECESKVFSCTVSSCL